jgi:hypothetical protein
MSRTCAALEVDPRLRYIETVYGVGYRFTRADPCAPSPQTDRGFVVIGFISIIIIVMLARWNTRTEFNRFVSDRRGSDLVTSLGEYYAGHGSWNGVQQAVNQQVVTTFQGPPPTGPRPTG